MKNTLNYRVVGSGQAQPILLLHGMLGSGLYWNNIAKQLKNNYQVITIDLLGFGDSPKPQDLQYTTDDHLRYIVATLDAIGVRKPMTAVGHSMGAILSLSLAKNYPEYVKNLVLISMPIYQNSAEARKKISNSKIVPKLMYFGPTARISCAVMCKFRPLAQSLVPYFYKHVPKDVAIDATKHTWYSYSRSMAHVIEQQKVLSDLKDLKIATTLIFGKDDNVTNSKNINSLKLSNPGLEIVELKGTHQIPIEQPEQIAQLIASFCQAK